ncbi:MAG: hypothetical protein OXG05_04020 [Gammaproteobacteria bacterium]|nr:hypothetical protein [Gammaproteobacteria bacterium]
MISSTDVIRNATVLDENASVLVVGNVDIYEESECLISVSRLEAEPFAIFECKRVGVEEGQKKGPQTIEKAKQGAYVARTVSALQKIRSRNGNILGVLEDSDGTYITDEYQVLLQKIINNREMYIPNGFIFTVGVVSNHGNWFTSNDLNKELHVLAQSYDWLLFLTDQGLVKFIEDLIISPEARFEPARHAFLSSYTGKKGRNKFTKVTMEATADRVLRQYFSENLDEIESWFNVINPGNAAPSELRSNLLSLSLKSRLGGFTDDSGKK